MGLYDDAIHCRQNPFLRIDCKKYRMHKTVSYKLSRHITIGTLRTNTTLYWQRRANKENRKILFNGKWNKHEKTSTSFLFFFFKRRKKEVFIYCICKIYYIQTRYNTEANYLFKITDLFLFLLKKWKLFLYIQGFLCYFIFP